MHVVRKRIVQMGERDLVFGPDLLPNNDLVDIVKFVPILVKRVHVLYKGSDFGPPGMAKFSAFAVKNGFLSKR